MHPHLTIWSRATILCEQCGRLFVVPASRADQRRFCSHACHVAWQRIAARERWEDRFWLRVARSGNDDCWPWTGHIKRNGYGRVWHTEQRCMINAHRVAWEITHGPVPDGLHVLHRCDARYPASDTTYRRCCNPAHLFLGTSQENSYDRHAKGRDYGGDRHWTRTNPENCLRGDDHWSHQLPEKVRRGEAINGSKLTPDIVRGVRELIAQGVSQAEIARMLGVNITSINKIHRGRTWKHVH